MGTVNVEAFRVTALLLVLGLQQLAVILEGPAVERAGEGGLVAALFAAQGGTTVGTGVQNRLELAILGPGDDHRLTTHHGGVVVARILDLALMGQENPVAFEDVFHLQLKQLFVGEDAAVTAVVASLCIGFHRVADRFLKSVELASHVRHSILLL